MALSQTQTMPTSRSKEQALARTKPLDSKPGRYRPPDAVLNFLDAL
jgi:hypothetical protein